MPVRHPRASLAALALCLVATAHAADKDMRIVDEGGIKDQWMLAEGTRLATPAYPAEFAKAKARDVCVALGYRINPDGTTSDFRVLKQWNSDALKLDPVDGFFAAFAQAGADALSQWKFQPRPNVTPEATYTVATLTWQTQKATDPAALRASCKVDNLAVTLQTMERRNNMSDHQVDRDNRTRQKESQLRAGTPRNSATGY